MKKLLSTIIRPRLTSAQTPGGLNRSRWVVVFTAGVTIAVVAVLLPSADGLLAVRPVHAFSKQTQEAGAATFHEKGCEHCHGVNGIGTDRGPDLSTIGKRWKKDHIERQIREGGGGMPPFGDALQADEVKALVDYLSAKRKAPKGIKPPVAVKPSTDESGF